MRMHVRAALIGILLRAAVVVSASVVCEGISVVRVLMYESVRLGELRRMQDRQLGTAEHRHGEQRRNHDLLHDLLHGAQQSRAAGSRQVVMSNGEKLPRGRRTASQFDCDSIVSIYAFPQRANGRCGATILLWRTQ